MKWADLMGDLVDVQPAFDALTTLNDKLTGKQEKAFAAHKLRKCIAKLRSTAKFLEDELKARKLNRP